ncbi:MAG TPA: biotin/lipoyl-containing protein [Acidimicrobiales bacterium]|nr:biotin/lipoyl-containing protein [Acidimicrobiales bacterium]
MSVDVHVPKMGMSTVEVVVTEVLVSPGDEVEAGQGLVVVEGDKVTFEIAAEVSGVVEEVLVVPEQECNVGDVVVRLGATTR